MISLNRNYNGGIKFLLVEEDPYYSFLIRAELKKSFNTRWLDVASTGAEGREVASHTIYDFLIVSYNLPDTDGLSLWLDIRRTSQDVPAILAISDSDDEQSLSQLKCNHFDFILKDANYPANLIPAVTRLLEINGRSYHDNILSQTKDDEEWLDALSQTATAINHEINNPLTTIIGATELLTKGNYNLEQRAQLKIAVIQESANRINDILIRLNHITRPISVNIPGGRRMIDINGSSEGVPNPSRIPSKITIKK